MRISFVCLDDDDGSLLDGDVSVFLTRVFGIPSLYSHYLTSSSCNTQKVPTRKTSRVSRSNSKPMYSIAGRFIWGYNWQTAVSFIKRSSKTRWLSNVLILDFKLLFPLQVRYQLENWVVLKWWIFSMQDMIFINWYDILKFREIKSVMCTQQSAIIFKSSMTLVCSGRRWFSSPIGKQ